MANRITPDEAGFEEAGGAALIGPAFPLVKATLLQDLKDPALYEALCAYSSYNLKGRGLGEGSCTASLPSIPKTLIAFAEAQTASQLRFDTASDRVESSLILARWAKRMKAKNGPARGRPWSAVDVLASLEYPSIARAIHQNVDSVPVQGTGKKTGDFRRDVDVFFLLTDEST